MENVVFHQVYPYGLEKEMIWAQQNAKPYELSVFKRMGHVAAFPLLLNDVAAPGGKKHYFIY